MKNRITEIDFLRGITIILMILYHLCYVLYYYYNFDIPFFSNPFNYLQLFISTTFITICGISSTLSKNNLLRGVKLSLVAILITAATYIFDNDYYIRFGIIHFLSTCTILYHFIRNFNYKKLIIVLIISIIISIIINNITTDISYLFALGIESDYFSSSDYFPIFPYLCIFIFGCIIGKIVYINKRNIFINFKENNFFVLIGRKSLFIYIIHQPIILSTIWLIDKLL